MILHLVFIHMNEDQGCAENIRQLYTPHAKYGETLIILDTRVWSKNGNIASKGKYLPPTQEESSCRSFNDNIISKKKVKNVSYSIS